MIHYCIFETLSCSALWGRKGIERNVREGGRTRGKGTEANEKASCLAPPDLAPPSYVDRFTLLAGHMEAFRTEAWRGEKGGVMLCRIESYI